MKLLSKIAVGALGLVLVLSIAFNAVQWRESTLDADVAERLKNDLRDLSMQKDSADMANDSITALFHEEQIKSDSLDKVIIAKEADISWLKKKLKDAEEDIEVITTDSIYTALKSIYECGDTTGMYLFTDCETRGIYVDVTKIPILEDVIAKQDGVIVDLKVKVNLKDTLLRVANDDIKDKKHTIDMLFKEVATGLIDKARIESELIDQRKKTGVWQIVSGGLAGGLILLLLL